MKLRSKSELLDKKKEFEERLLYFERAKQEKDRLRYENYLKVLNWVLLEDVN
jgi:hypothetical protein